jgi:pilus assembly protein FimV
MDLDFDLDDRAYAADQAATPLTVPAALDLPGQSTDEPDGLDFDIDFEPRASTDARTAGATPFAGSSNPAGGMPPTRSAPATPLEFDLGSLTLDLGDPAPAGTVPAAAQAPDALAEDDPLATKLALAEEFSSIGDEDGARALAEEVLEEATGPLRARAQRFLTELSS